MTFDQVGILWDGNYIVRFYGILLVSGAFAGGYLATLEARRKGYNPDWVWDGLLWVLIGGILGARLWHILTPPPSMVAQGLTTAYYFNLVNVEMVRFGPWTFSIPAAFAIPNGGLGIPGAVAGGLLALYVYTRTLKTPFVHWADMVAPSLALGQAIGRWGNFVNQELYGQPTTLPWGLTIDALHRIPGFTDPALKFHPTFLYESIGNLLICLALLYIGRRYAARLKTGDLFWLYLLFYPTLRFGLEFIRLDSAQVFKLNANQTLMLVLAITAVGMLLTRHRRARRYTHAPTAPAAGA